MYLTDTHALCVRGRHLFVGSPAALTMKNAAGFCVRLGSLSELWREFKVPKEDAITEHIPAYPPPLKENQ